MIRETASAVAGGAGLKTEWSGLGPLKPNPRLGDQGRRKKMACYGFEHRYGADTVDEQGAPIGTLFVFRTRSGRDEWAMEGEPHQNNPKERTAMKSRAAARFRKMSSAVEIMDN